jgi:CDP-diglyceride synthetase
VAEDAVSNKSQWFLVGGMVALLVAALWYCVAIWRSTASMPLYGNIILGVAVVLALVAGCGLTALMYYSQRKGYDEPARSDRTPRE